MYKTGYLSLRDLSARTLSGNIATPTPTVSITITPTITPTLTITPTITITPTLTITPTPPPNSAIDVIGFNVGGAYIDGNDTLYACSYTYGNDCGCCGTDSYSNCNYCGYYYFYPVVSSSSFNSSYTFGNKSFKANSGSFACLVSYPASSLVSSDCGNSCIKPSDINATSGGSHYAAIKGDNTLWTWGYNGNGQLGNGNTTSNTSPVQVGTGNNWSMVSVGNGYVLAVKYDGTLWSWGRNDNGELGIGSTVYKSSPTQIGSGTTWVKVFAGNTSAYAIKSNGTLWAWGGNGIAQLGDGTSTSRSSPVQIGSATNWDYVAPGTYGTNAIRTDGTLWGWGYNYYYQTGLGSSTIYYNPTQVGTATNWKQVTATHLYYGSNHGIKTDGTLWGWGYQPWGIGYGTYGAPYQITSATNHFKLAEGFWDADAIGGVYVINTSGNVIKYYQRGTSTSTYYTGGRAAGLRMANFGGGTVFLLKAQ